MPQSQVSVFLLHTITETVALRVWVFRVFHGMPLSSEQSHGCQMTFQGSVIAQEKNIRTTQPLPFIASEKQWSLVLTTSMLLSWLL